jgi:hypothetical protein
MFAVDHAATALLIKRRFPSVPITALDCHSHRRSITRLAGN